MQTEPNNPKLKLAMARLLPEKMTTEHGIPGWKGTGNIVTDVLETEWLYVMHLVEQTLTIEEKQHYYDELCLVVNDADSTWIESGCVDMARNTALTTFNQRATAMCKVKGIEV